MLPIIELPLSKNTKVYKSSHMHAYATKVNLVKHENDRLNQITSAFHNGCNFVMCILKTKLLLILSNYYFSEVTGKPEFSVYM